MPDEPHQHESSARSMRRLQPPAPSARGGRVAHAGDRTLRVRMGPHRDSAPGTGPGGLVAGALLLAAALAALVVGAVAITVALWIVLSIAVLGIVVAGLRRLLGTGPRPGRR